MQTLLLRLFVALLFVLVETVFFVALHTYFSKQMDRMKNWFGRHSWRTVAVMLPLLFATNFAVTFLFSGVAAVPATRVEQEANQADSVGESEPRREKRLLPEKEELPSKETPAPTEEEKPIPGVPADETWE
jgi:hypothetical protein